MTYYELKHLSHLENLFITYAIIKAYSTSIRLTVS